VKPPTDNGHGDPVLVGEFCNRRSLSPATPVAFSQNLNQFVGISAAEVVFLAPDLCPMRHHVGEVFCLWSWGQVGRIIAIVTVGWIDAEVPDNHFAWHFGKLQTPFDRVGDAVGRRWAYTVEAHEPVSKPVARCSDPWPACVFAAGAIDTSVELGDASGTIEFIQVAFTNDPAAWGSCDRMRHRLWSAFSFTLGPYYVTDVLALRS
jgi:hypothetical protein